MSPEAYRLIRTDDYEAACADLTPSARLALRVIEEGIAHNPFSYPGVNAPGHERHDYGDWVAVRSEDLLISYAIRGSTVVLLYVTRDLSAPPWSR